MQVIQRQNRMPTWEEQKLCIGSSFQLAATNGHDPARRINIEGFCQSVDYLFESIEDSVQQQRGEILLEERVLKGGLHEILKLTVAVPFLWGVPPQLEMLSWVVLNSAAEICIIKMPFVLCPASLIFSSIRSMCMTFFLLWELYMPVGVFPSLTFISGAIASGGGIVHRTYHQWVVTY